MAANNDNSASKLQKIRIITALYIDSLVAQGLIEESVLDEVMNEIAMSKGYVLAFPLEKIEGRTAAGFCFFEM